MKNPPLGSTVPPLRIRALNNRSVRSNGECVLYWMNAYRRTQSNYALTRAYEWSRELGLPLVILSALRLDYPFASPRLHAFILDSMADVASDLEDTNVELVQYVEPEHGAGKGLLAALGANAAVIVTDDAPVFFLPAMVAAAAERLAVLVEGVDHNGLLPLAATDRVFLRAYDLRRYLQRELPNYLDEAPADLSLADVPPAPVGLLGEARTRWPSAPVDRTSLDRLPLAGTVPVVDRRGGQQTAARLVDRFVATRLARYEDRNHPDESVTSELSPYLHFGNVSPHQVFSAVAQAEQWDPSRLSDSTSGARAGWWGMGEAAESFLDQLVTWRELGYRSARYVPNNGEYSALPAWARATLADHAADPREFTYTEAQLDGAETHDEIWNAAQLELRERGSLHNYLRMLWGKKILEWTRSPEEAHDIMFTLNDKYALDGRDPNSVSGIHWVLGRYDRPWGPERAIFGKVRYMSSDSTRRKLRMTGYLNQSKTLETKLTSGSDPSDIV